ncbi:MAG: type II toxin-antitoxin system HicA family toxin [Candidatus Brockarchaeota archaeon]|nr:type II toxin-antitoxin system HicA family toxin [Candidatus Brockarchaeota archaeon]
MRLPVVSGKDMVKLLSKQGFQIIRQKGDHVSLFKRVDNEPLLVIVPLKKEIKKGTLLNILRQARISREEFLKLIEEL